MDNETAYGDFAYLYDELMDNVPYENWATSIIAILKEFSIDEGLVLDLGCGTGKMTMLLNSYGYDMIGVDLSEDMLNIARDNAYNEGISDILYLCQDMREFELYGTVRSVISICDCINYLISDKDIIKTFKLVNNYLDPDGIFIFDFNTIYKYRDVIGDSTICENREDLSFIWENYYDESSELNEYDITFYVKEKNSELYKRFEETHIQKGYSLPHMIELVEQSGLIFIKAIDVETGRIISKGEYNVTSVSERVLIVCKENGKNTKQY